MPIQLIEAIEINPVPVTGLPFLSGLPRIRPIDGGQAYEHTHVEYQREGSRSSARIDLLDRGGVFATTRGQCCETFSCLRAEIGDLM